MKLEEACYGLVVLRRYCNERFEVRNNGLVCNCPFNTAYGCRLDGEPHEWRAMDIVNNIKRGLCR